MAEERVRRRLAAILAADVVGYSRLMEADEEGTLARVMKLRDDVIAPRVAAYGGRIFKTTGDGVLVEFPSATDAVRHAVDVQRAIAALNGDLPEASRMQFRIGISLGDVMVDGDDLFGNGVNVAARMEGLAEPGGICISGNVQEHIGGSSDIALEDLGEQSVKNIDRPVQCYRVRLVSGDPSIDLQPGPDGALPLPDKPSIAVLPFTNMSGDPEQEYFSDGITEDIITELSKISGLLVIARHSAFVYKGKSVNLKQVGRELGVRCVLEGSVRKAGDRLRISAQLIDATTDHHLWAERYDRELKDVFVVQDEVAHSVAEALAVALKPTERARVGRFPAGDPDAYDHYLRLRAAPWPPTRGNLLISRNAYGRIIARTPDFAGGYAGQSLTHSLAVMFGHSDDTVGDGRMAVELALRAVALDPAFAPAHSALASAYSATGQHDEAITAARRAIELQPGDADAYSWLSRSLLLANRAEEACVAARTAFRLDPQFIDGPLLNLLGRTCFAAGRYDEAIDAYRRNAYRGGPIYVTNLAMWAVALGAVGRDEEAAAKMQELHGYDPAFSLARARTLHRFASDDERARLVDGLRKAGLAEG